MTGQRSLEGARVLVTGATGFIGGRLAERLASKGAVVTGAGRRLDRARRLEQRGVDLQEADLLDDARMSELVDGQDLVFHSAAWVGGEPGKAYAVNVTATERLVDMAGRAGIGRFVHVSTVGAYDLEGVAVATEETPLGPEQEGEYGSTKAIGELRARAAAEPRGLELAIVRPAMVYGPHSSIWTVALVEAIRAEKPVLLGDGSGSFNPVYIDNLVDALLLCATVPAAAGEAFNVVDGTTTWRDFVGRYATMLGRSPHSISLWQARLVAAVGRLPFVHTRISDRLIQLATARIEFSTGKARERLGWEPKVGLEEGMSRTEEWLREAGYL